jgi:hypothetical protein
MASLLQAIVDFFKDSLEGDQAAGDPPPPGKLSDIADIKNKLSGIELNTSHNGLADWLDALDGVLNDIALRDTIIVRALQLRAPRVAEALTLAGLIEVEFRDLDPRAFAFRIAWNRLDAFFRSPGDTALLALLDRVQDLDDLKVAQVLTGLLLFSPRELLKLEYAEQGYAALPDPRPTGAIDLIQLVQDLINSPLKLGVPVTPPLDVATFKAKAIAGQALPTDYLAILGHDALGANKLDGFGIELKLSNAASFAAGSIDLGGGMRLVASTTDAGAQTYRLVMKNGTFDPSQASSGNFESGVSFDPQGGTAVIGPPDDTRLEVGRARLLLRLQRPDQPGTPLFTLRAAVERVVLVFSTKLLGLLASIAAFPAEVRFQTDIGIAYLQGIGLQSMGDDPGLPPLATEFTVPLNLRAGTSDAGVTVERVLVRIEAKLAGETLRSRLVLRFGAKGEFGPVRVGADGMGAWFGHWDGDFGGVEGPTALGISLQAGPVSGGGFLARLPGEEYGGGLEVKVMSIGVGAFALFGKADGAPAFVGILGIRLPFPGVQIGFGFAIIGVGGLIGINRRADTDVLREQLAYGTSGQILFCDNPTKNALTVIGQLPRLFPPARGVFIVGPTFQISWLELLRLDVGIFIVLPGPQQIFIAGSARLVIGSEAFALVYLRMDFVGGIDLTKSLIYFDAVLVNSHVMQVFKITGGIALRLAYGDNGYFLFCVGGFHPSFNPGGLELPRLARAGTCASVGIAWFKLENYFALTSNTFQIGAAIEAGIELGPISAHGWFRFDAMVQFEPFYFTALIDAGFDVEVFGRSFCGVRLQGALSGPGPLVVQAKASVKLLFVRVSESVTIKLGSSGGSPVPGISDILSLLVPEFTKPANIRSDGEDRSVVLRPGAPSIISGVPVVGAVGAIIWEQKRVPFGLDLQRFEGAPLAPGSSGNHHLELTSKAPLSSAERDWFGVGTYLTLAESEALNNARFTQAQSGIRISLSAMTDGAKTACTVVLNLVKLPQRRFFKGVDEGIFATNYMTSSLVSVHQERAGAAMVQAGGPRVTTSQEFWNAHDPSGGIIKDKISSTQAFLLTRGGKGIAQPAATTGTVSLQGVF